MKLVGYARISSPSEKEGLAGQKERILTWANAHGHGVVIEEEVVSASGKVPRPVFEKAMDMALSTEYDGLIVDGLDRFARSVQDAIYHVNRLKDAEKKFVAVKMNIDITDPMGKVMFTVLIAVSEMEREIINERMKLGRERAKRLGKKMGGPKRKELPRDVILKDLELGAPIGYVANKWDVSESTLRRRVKEWGVDIAVLRGSKV